MTDTATRPQRARRTQAADVAVSAPEAPAPNGNGHDIAPRADAHGPLGPVPLEKVRKPMGQLRYKLDNTPRTGFHRQWFNDDKNRIQDALDAGYAFINGVDGKPMSYVAGTKKEGGPLTAYRMEMPIHLWQQDQDAKVAVRRQRQQDMQRGVTGRGAPGDDGRYVPLGPDGRPLTQIKHEVS